MVLASALVVSFAPGASAAPSARNTTRATAASALRDPRGFAAPSAKKNSFDSVIPATGDYVPGEVIVRFDDDASAVAKSRAGSRAGASSTRRVGKSVPGLAKATLKKGVSVESAVAAYEEAPGVLYAQPNYIKRATKMPNDPLFSHLWGMHNPATDADIDAPEAWDVTTGSSNVVIAVLDTGVDYEHPDLAANMWTNPDETPGNGLDDDGNGYVDDVYGADTISGDGDPFDGNGHGTHCAGTIGGKGNDGSGVVGVNWNVKIMAVKMLDDFGSGTTESAIKAFEYINAKGAKLSSNSWGGAYPFDQAEYDAINSVNKLFVFAAGNADSDNEITPFYPSAYDLPNILSVGASTSGDAKASFSNYGRTRVDVFAPGEDIVSTAPAVRTFIPDVAATLFSDPMGDLDDWVNLTEPGYASNPWAITTGHFASGPSSVANLNYVNDQWSYIEIAEPLDLSDGEPAYLNAKIRYNIEDGYDFGLVYGYSEASGFKLLHEYTGSSSGAFEDVWVDLSPFLGDESVRISFELYSDETNSSADGYDGVWVDDVRVVRPQTSTIGTDDFSSLSGWNTDGWERNPWALSDTRAQSAPYSLSQTNHAGTGQYADDEFAFAYQSTGVTPGPSGLGFMRYKLWQSTVADEDLFGPVVNSGGGLAWGEQPTSESTSGWESRSTPVAGGPHSTHLRFGFGFLSDAANSAEGVYVDDLEFVNVLGSWAPADYSAAFDQMSGTSMATPHVAGIAALALAVNPTASPALLKQTVMNTADKKPGLTNYCVSGGRANANSAVRGMYGKVIGKVTWNGAALSGVTVKVGSRPAVTTASNGTYSVGTLPPGTYNVTFSKSGYVSKTLTGVGVGWASTATRNMALARTVVKPTIARSPSSSKVTYKRKRGVAKFTLSAKVKGWGGLPITGRYVYLQTSKNGKTGWKNTYKIKTSSAGKASKYLKIKKKSVKYYRWYVPAKAGVNTSAYTSKQKVTVK